MIKIIKKVEIIAIIQVRGKICYAIDPNTKANNKYMKDYDKNKKSSYLKYWDVNN